MPRSWMLFAPLLLLASQAHAVIKVEQTIDRLYKSARSVAVGKIAKTNAENRVLEVHAITTFRGEAVAEKVRIQIATPEKLFPALKVDDPIVMFIERATDGTTALLSVGDTWLLANQLPNNATAWRTVNLHDTKGAFPGRTTTLVKLLDDIKAGKASLLNDIKGVPFGKELVAFQDEVPKFPANTLEVTGSFGPADEKAVIKVSDSTLERTLDTTVDTDGLLTGMPITSYVAAHKEGLKPLTLVPIHINPDKRQDLLIITKEATLLLINRGYGVFLVDASPTPALFVDKKPIYDDKTHFTATDKGLLIKFSDNSVKLLPLGNAK